jgi:hypothetical protein
MLEQNKAQQTYTMGNEQVDHFPTHKIYLQSKNKRVSHKYGQGYHEKTKNYLHHSIITRSHHQISEA